MENKNEKSRLEKSIHEGDIYVEWMEPATGDVTSNENPQEIRHERNKHIWQRVCGCQYCFANGINKSRTKSAGDGDVLYCRDSRHGRSSHRYLFDVRSCPKIIISSFRKSFFYGQRAKRAGILMAIFGREITSWRIASCLISCCTCKK